MPLIVVTGLPSSGKSETSKKILSYFESKLKEEGDARQVRIVSDSDSLDWDGRDVIYSSIAKEKELRGWLRAESQRYVNLNQIVILDAAAYIKGFRYELFCMSKEAKTQYCIVERLINSDTCWKWNENIRSKNMQNGQDIDSGYSRETFDALVMRYENCDEKNRWDSPLLRIESEEDELNFEKIYNIITKEQPLSANKCTSLTSTSTTIYKSTK